MEIINLKNIMGKSLIIEGIDASITGLGNISDANEEWLLKVDKNIFEQNLSGSSYIQGVIVWYGSAFNNGDNLFENREIVCIRGYFNSACTVSFGVYSNSKYIAKTEVLSFVAGYQEVRFANSFKVEKGEYLALNIISGSIKSSDAPGIGFTYLGVNYTGKPEGSTTGIIFMDFKAKVESRLYMYSEEIGFISSNGSISTEYGGKHHKYKIIGDVNTVFISGKIGVDNNGQWAIYQLRKNGNIIKTQTSTQTEYNRYKVDVSNADEIWVNRKSKNEGEGPMDIELVE